MRFMMLLPAPPEPLEKLTAAPNKEIVLAMRKYNEEIKKAGVLLLAEGLHATSKGFRIRVTGGRKIVLDGPFTEAKEVIAGFAILNVSTKEEAVQRTREFLSIAGDGECELRQIFEGQCEAKAKA